MNLHSDTQYQVIQYIKYPSTSPLLNTIAYTMKCRYNILLWCGKSRFLHPLLLYNAEVHFGTWAEYQSAYVFYSRLASWASMNIAQSMCNYGISKSWRTILFIRLYFNKNWVTQILESRSIWRTLLYSTLKGIIFSFGQFMNDRHYCIIKMFEKDLTLTPRR